MFFPVHTFLTIALKQLKRQTTAHQTPTTILPRTTYVMANKHSYTIAKPVVTIMRDYCLLPLIAVFIVVVVAWLTHRKCTRNGNGNESGYGYDYGYGTMEGEGCVTGRNANAKNEFFSVYNRDQGEQREFVPSGTAGLTRPMDAQWVPPVTTTTNSSCPMDHIAETQTLMQKRFVDPSAKTTPYTRKFTPENDKLFLRVMWAPEFMAAAHASSNHEMTGTFDVTVHYVYDMGEQKNVSHSITMLNQPFTYRPNVQSDHETTVPNHFELPLCFSNRVIASTATVTRLVLERVDTYGGTMGVERVFVIKRRNADGRVLHVGSWSVEPVAFVSPTTNGNGMGFPVDCSIRTTYLLPYVSSAVGEIHYQSGVLPATIAYNTLKYSRTTRVHRMSVTFAAIGGKGGKTISRSPQGGSSVSTDITLYFTHMKEFHPEQKKALVEAIRNGNITLDEDRKLLVNATKTYPLSRSQFASVTLSGVHSHQTCHFEIALALPSTQSFDEGFVAVCDHPVKIQSWTTTPLYRPPTKSTATSTAQPPTSYEFDQRRLLSEPHAPDTMQTWISYNPLVLQSSEMHLAAEVSPYETIPSPSLTNISAPHGAIIDSTSMVTPFGHIVRLRTPPEVSLGSNQESDKMLVITRHLPSPQSNDLPSYGIAYYGSVMLPASYALVGKPAVQCNIRFANKTRILMTIEQDRVFRLAVLPFGSGRVHIINTLPKSVEHGKDVEWYLHFYRERYTLTVNKMEVASGTLPSNAVHVLYGKRQFNLLTSNSDTNGYFSSTDTTRSYPPTTCVTLKADPFVHIDSRFCSQIHVAPSKGQHITHHVEAYRTVIPRNIIYYLNENGTPLKHIITHYRDIYPSQMHMLRRGIETDVGVMDPQQRRGPAYGYGLTTRSLEGRTHVHAGITMTAMLTPALFDFSFGREIRLHPTDVFNQTVENENGKGKHRRRYRTLLETDTFRVAIQQRLPRNTSGVVTDYFAFDLVVFFLNSCGTQYSNTAQVLSPDSIFQDSRTTLLVITYSSHGRDERICLHKHDLNSPLKMVQSFPHKIPLSFVRHRQSDNSSLFTTCSFDQNLLYSLVVADRISPSQCNPYDSGSGCECASAITGDPYNGITNYQTTPSMTWVNAVSYPDMECSNSEQSDGVTTYTHSTMYECQSNLIPRAMDSNHKLPNMVSYNPNTRTCKVCLSDHSSLKKQSGTTTFSRQTQLYDRGISEILK